MLNSSKSLANSSGKLNLSKYNQQEKYVHPRSIREELHKKTHFKAVASISLGGQHQSLTGGNTNEPS